MIFKNSVLKELRYQANIIFSCLITVVVTMALIRTLGNAASGKTGPEIVVPLILFSTFSSLGTIAALTAFLSVFMCFSRMYNDNEMVVWRTNGLKIMDFLPTVTYFLLPITIFAALVTLLGTPWARSQADILREQSRAEHHLAKFSPGKFSEFSNGEKLVFFEQTKSDSLNLGLVFVRSKDENGKETIVLGNKGRLEFIDNVPWVNLKDGSQIDFHSMQANPRIDVTKFGSYSMRLDNSPKSQAARTRIKSTNSWTLFKRQSPSDLGELSFRLGTILLCLTVPFLAIPFALKSNKNNQLLNVLTAILVFIFANHLLGIIQALISKETISWLSGQILLPILTLTIAFFLIFKEDKKFGGPT